MVVQITAPDGNAAWMSEARRATPEHEEITLAVMEMVEAWQVGSLPLWSVMHQCTPQERWVAANHVKRGTEEFTSLMALLDAIIAEQDVQERAWQTKHGRFTADDLAEFGGKVVRGVIHWPAWGSRERGYGYREPMP